MGKCLSAKSSVGAGLAELSPERPALALVSVPGAYAALEAADAIAAGRSVLIFSDGVPVEQEVALKRAAHDAGVLVMGPDGGTAIVSGAALGFANVVRPGSVGVVAASGTGAQQVSCLLDMAGVGVSHVLGVGGRDLTAAVGGLATLDALAALDSDPATERVLLVSKPPAPAVAETRSRPRPVGVRARRRRLRRRRPHGGARPPDDRPHAAAGGDRGPRRLRRGRRPAARRGPRVRVRSRSGRRPGPGAAGARARRRLPVVVALIGTEADPQGLSRQADALPSAGAAVFASNAAATRYALGLLGASA